MLYTKNKMVLRFFCTTFFSMVIAALLLACGGGLTTTDIVQTQTAQNKIENATATAEAWVEKGGDAANVVVQVGAGSTAAKAQEKAFATATAMAEAGIKSVGVGSAVGSEESQLAGGFEYEIPEGDPLSGEIIVDIKDVGASKIDFVPKIVKISKGSTVKWTNARKSASSTTADEGQDDYWDSDAMSKGTFDKEPSSYKHVFEQLGCFTYRSLYSGDAAQGAICVVE
jgi:plastocyanin